MGDDVKAEDGGSCRLCQNDRAGLGDKTWTARTIDGEGRIPALLQALNHFDQGAARASRTGPSRSAVPMFSDDAGDVFSVEVLAGHHHDAALAPEPGGGANFPMPEGINQASAMLLGGFPVFPAKDFPAKASTYQPGKNISQPGGHRNLSALPSCELPGIFLKLRRGFRCLESA